MFTEFNLWLEPVNQAESKVEQIPLWQLIHKIQESAPYACVSLVGGVLSDMVQGYHSDSEDTEDVKGDLDLQFNIDIKGLEQVLVHATENAACIKYQNTCYVTSPDESVMESPQIVSNKSAHDIKLLEYTVKPPKLLTLGKRGDKQHIDFYSARFSSPEDTLTNATPACRESRFQRVPNYLPFISVNHREQCPSGHPPPYQDWVPTTSAEYLFNRYESALEPAQKADYLSLFVHKNHHS